MKPIHIAIIITTLLIGGAVLLAQNKPSGASVLPTGNSVVIENGQQIINITAKGGYLPRTSVAQAGIPTIIRFHTRGTFDCSSYIRIPSMGVSQYLPSTGATDIAIADPQAGLLQGMCGMGMYPFEVDFKN